MNSDESNAKAAGDPTEDEVFKNNCEYLKKFFNDVKSRQKTGVSQEYQSQLKGMKDMMKMFLEEHSTDFTKPLPLGNSGDQGAISFPPEFYAKTGEYKVKDGRESMFHDRDILDLEDGGRHGSSKMERYMDKRLSGKDYKAQVRDNVSVRYKDIHNSARKPRVIDSTDNQSDSSGEYGGRKTDKLRHKSKKGGSGKYKYLQPSHDSASSGKTVVNNFLTHRDDSSPGEYQRVQRDKLNYHKSDQRVSRSPRRSHTNRTYRKRVSTSRRQHSSGSSTSSGVESSRSRRLLKFMDQRERPTLGKFKEDGPESLQDFILDFEQHCKRNCQGGPRYWNAILEKHLEGKLLEVFKWLCDDYKDYFKARDKLIKWYEDNEELRLRKCKKKFRSAQPKHDESLFMFSIRLECLFKRAYPRSEVGKSKKLMDQFKYAIPKKAREALNAQIMHCKLRNERPNWEYLQQCVKFKDLDDELEASSESDREVGRRKRREVVINLSQGEKRPSRPRVQEPRIGRSGTDRRCYTCGYEGHMSRECRWNLGLCVVCGDKGHFIRDCPNKRPDYIPRNGEGRNGRSSSFSSQQRNGNRSGQTEDTRNVQRRSYSVAPNGNRGSGRGNTRGSCEFSRGSRGISRGGQRQSYNGSEDRYVDAEQVTQQIPPLSGANQQVRQYNHEAAEFHPQQQQDLNW